MLLQLDLFLGDFVPGPYDVVLVGRWNHWRALIQEPVSGDGYLVVGHLLFLCVAGKRLDQTRPVISLELVR